MLNVFIVSVTYGKCNLIIASIIIWNVFMAIV